MIKNLQVLRAVAALLVVFFHCDFENIKIGQFGVDIFFVISGFIISFVLYKNQSNFLIKRFIRVVPMYYLFTIALICAWLVYPGLFKNVYISAEAIVKSLCFIPYYVGDSGPILSLGWTLNYEIFFYVTVGVFSILTKRPGIALVLSIATILLVVILFRLTNSSNFYWLFYSHEITIEFTFGVILFFITKKLPTFFQKKSVIVIAGLLALVAFTLMGYFDYHKIYFSRTLLFGLPAFFIVLFFIVSENVTNGNNAFHRYIYKLGNASYVIYLCHPFIIYFIIRFINPLLPVGIIYSVFEVILMLSLVILVSTWIHKKLELPVVRFLEKTLHKYSANHQPVSKIN